MVLYILWEGFTHILRRFCTYFKMRRKYTYSKKVLYIFSINAKDLRRCEGCAKEIYTPQDIAKKNTYSSPLVCLLFFHLKQQNEAGWKFDRICRDQQHTWLKLHSQNFFIKGGTIDMGFLICGNVNLCSKYDLIWS